MRDPRGGGRSSARLTAPTVAAGAVAKKWLAAAIRHAVSRLHDAAGRAAASRSRAGSMCAATRSLPPWPTCASYEDYMDACARPGDSCGARIRVQATGVPVGLGEPLYDKLDADIAYAMMGLNAVKGVEIGAGFASVAQRGTTHGDSLTPQRLSHQQRRWRAGRHQHRARPGSERLPSSPPAPSSARASPSTSTASRPRSSPRAATTPAWASAPRRLPRRCWRWW
jgi:chorismate synthase